jgi:hypothetical protein
VTRRSQRDGYVRSDIIRSQVGNGAGGGVRQKPRKLPALPTEIQTPLGPLSITIEEAQPHWPNGGRGSGGYYDSRQYRMYIAKDLSLQTQWHILWHERGHNIADLGVEFDSDGQEESFCKSFATMMLHEMLYG